MIDKEQLERTRGFAILLIFIHNYLTKVFGISGNEFVWNEKDLSFLLNQADGILFLFSTIAYIGWIGVPVFLFLSGYGLDAKYFRQTVGLNFIVNHYKKLFFLFVPVYFIYIFLFSILHLRTFEIRDIVCNALMIQNLIDYKNLSIGVFWYFSLALQFYFFYLLINRIKKKSILVLLFCFSVILDYILLYYPNKELIICLKHNLIGWTTPFLFGCLFHRLKFDLSKIKRVSIVLYSVLLFVLLIISQLLKIFSPLTCILSVLLLLLLSTANISAIRYLGIISSSVFVVHPVLRNFFVSVPCLSLYLLKFLPVYIIVVVIVSSIHFCFKHLTSCVISNSSSN